MSSIITIKNSSGDRASPCNISLWILLKQIFSSCRQFYSQSFHDFLDEADDIVW